MMRATRTADEEAHSSTYRCISNRNHHGHHVMRLTYGLMNTVVASMKITSGSP